MCLHNYWYNDPAVFHGVGFATTGVNFQYNNHLFDNKTMWTHHFGVTPLQEMWNGPFLDFVGHGYYDFGFDYIPGETTPCTVLFEVRYRGGALYSQQDALHSEAQRTINGKNYHTLHNKQTGRIYMNQPIQGLTLNVTVKSAPATSDVFYMYKTWFQFSANQG